MCTHVRTGVRLATRLGGGGNRFLEGGNVFVSGTYSNLSNI